MREISTGAPQTMHQPSSRRRPVCALCGSSNVVCDPIIRALNEYRNATIRVLEERGEDCKDPSARTLEDESKALRKIGETVPRTIYGALHLAKFIRSTVQDELIITDYQAALEDNLICALQRISGSPAPEVAPYFY
jgi:hypothetical protein